MARNGKQRPGRPRIELRQASASTEEAAAIAAAIEQFLRDTAPPPEQPGPRVSGWARTGLLAATGHGSAQPTPWGDPVPWGGGR